MNAIEQVFYHQPLLNPKPVPGSTNGRSRDDTFTRTPKEITVGGRWDGVMIGSKSDLDSQVFATVLRILSVPIKLHNLPPPLPCLSTFSSKTNVKNLETEVQGVHVNEQCITRKLIQSLRLGATPTGSLPRGLSIVFYSVTIYVQSDYNALILTVLFKGMMSSKGLNRPVWRMIVFD